MADMEAARTLIGGAIERATRRIVLLADQGHGFARTFRNESRNAAKRGVQLHALLHGVDQRSPMYGDSYQLGREAANILSEDGWVVRSSANVATTTCLIVDGVAILEATKQFKGLASTELVRVTEPAIVQDLLRHFEHAWVESVNVIFEDVVESSAPEPAKEIAHVAEETWEAVIAHLAEHPEELRNVSPRKFEELVAELLVRDGFEVHLTPRSQDGGRDILAQMNSALGKHLFYVECKRYRSRPVGVEIVRALYGTVTKDTASAGVIVTTSTFTRGALAFARDIEHRMSLKNYDSLVAWMRGSGRDAA